MIDKKKVNYGDTVTLTYVGRFENGDIFDATREGEPFVLKVGETPLIKGFEEALIGMEVGESKSFEVPPEKAYGNHLDDLMIEVERKNFPEGMELKKGMEIEVTSQDGTQNYIFSIFEVGEEKVILDGNHPLAGKTLHFDVRIESIK